MKKYTPGSDNKFLFDDLGARLFEVGDYSSGATIRGNTVYYNSKRTLVLSTSYCGLKVDFVSETLFWPPCTTIYGHVFDNISNFGNLDLKNMP